LHAMQALCQL